MISSSNTFSANIRFAHQFPERTDAAELFRLSDQFSDVSYVLLSDLLLVGAIEQAKVYGDKLFLLGDRRVLIFDVHSGKALLDVSCAGSGPGGSVKNAYRHYFFCEKIFIFEKE